MLLERQVVIFCPNIGVLTSSVLALIPLVRPYAWQSLLLPVLPATEQMLDFLQARSWHSDLVLCHPFILTVYVMFTAPAVVVCCLWQAM